MMVIFSKLLKDFWYAKSKLLLMILAAALSVWGISSVLYSYVLSERDFQVNFSQTFPADIEILIENYHPGIEGALLADDQVVDLERREILGGRVKNRNGAWMSFLLFGVEDIQNMRMDVFQVKEEIRGKHPKILIEQNARYFLDEDLDSITVQFPDRQEVVWKIGGTSHDARLAPARMERTVFAHATSLKALEPFLKKDQRRLLVETKVSTDIKQLQEVAGRLREIGEKEGSPVRILSIPRPGKHIHQNIVDGVSFMQRGSGLILSVMGVILLSLILLTWVFPQIGDVGRMKAMGASTRRIFISYLLVFILLVGVGLLLGMPLGYLTAVAYNDFVAFIQNFEPVKAPMPLAVHMVVVVLSSSIPFLFAIIPLSNASKTTVSEAINKTFDLPNKKIFAATQQFIPNSSLLYGLNNLFRNVQRSLLLILLMAVGLGLFFTGSDLDYSVRSELRDFAQRANYQLRVRFSKDLRKEQIAFLEELPFVTGMVPMRDIELSYQPPNAGHTETRRMRVLSSKHRITDDLVLQGKIKPDCPECLYISGESMRQEFEHLAIGQTIPMRDTSGETKLFIYSGVFKDMAAIGSPFFSFSDNELPTFNALAFEIKDGFSASEVSQNMDDVLLENGIDMAGMLHVQTRLGQLIGHLEPTFLILKVSGSITVMIGFFGLLIVLGLSIQERTREIGIMKSIGCSLSKISRLFQVEFLLLSAIAILIGALVALPLTSSLCRVLTKTVIYHYIPPQANLLVTGLSALAVLLIQIIAIAVFNRFKIRKNARELLGHQF